MPLTELSPGQKAKVTELAGGRGMQRRLASMGLTVGAEVETVICRGRGPIVVAVRQTRLALGRAIASKIVVEPVKR